VLPSNGKNFFHTCVLIPCRMLEGKAAVAKVKLLFIVPTKVQGVKSRCKGGIASQKRSVIATQYI